jgi:tryptophanyl-tRNA synthetase
LWSFHDVFNKDTAWVEEYKSRYTAGRVGDVEVKKKLVDVLNDFLDPIRTRRKYFEQHPEDVLATLRSGTERARQVTSETMKLVKRAIRQDYW